MCKEDKTLTKAIQKLRTKNILAIDSNISRYEKNSNQNQAVILNTILE